MSILTWSLATAPAQAPEFWLLFVDGAAWCSLANQAPYVGAGQYSVDLTQLDSNVQITDGLAHAFSVALVGNGFVGAQSAAVTATVPAPTAPIVFGGGTSTAVPVPIGWPVASAVSLT
jgi:hypothetical protein